MFCHRWGSQISSLGNVSAVNSLSKLHHWLQPCGNKAFHLGYCWIQTWKTNVQLPKALAYKQLSGNFWEKCSCRGPRLCSKSSGPSRVYRGFCQPFPNVTVRNFHRLPKQCLVVGELKTLSFPTRLLNAVQHKGKDKISSQSASFSFPYINSRKPVITEVFQGGY